MPDHALHPLKLGPAEACELRVCVAGWFPQEETQEVQGMRDLVEHLAAEERQRDGHIAKRCILCFFSEHAIAPRLRHALRLLVAYLRRPAGALIFS